MKSGASRQRKRSLCKKRTRLFPAGSMRKSVHAVGDARHEHATEPLELARRPSWFARVRGALLPLIDVKEMGIGLAAAVLIDATIVRAALLPPR